MHAVSDLGRVLSTRLGIDAVVVGHSVAANPTWWDRELAKALPHLQKMGNRIDEVLSAGLVPITAMTRCAVALATQPRLVSHHPEAVVVWLDAHGDINVPEDTKTGDDDYSGGSADTVEADIRGYLAEVERSDAALASHHKISSTGLGHDQTLGFVLIKMIDEYALHSGQAHMIRFAALGLLTR